MAGAIIFLVISVVCCGISFKLQIDKQKRRQEARSKRQNANKQAQDHRVNLSKEGNDNKSNNTKQCSQCGSKSVIITKKLLSNYVQVQCLQCQNVDYAIDGEPPERIHHNCNNCGGQWAYTNDRIIGICTHCHAQVILDNNKYVDSIKPNHVRIGNTFKSPTISFSKMSKGNKRLIIIMLICFLLWLAGSCDPNNSHRNKSNYSYGKEVRCWNCQKVIINSEGRAIHASHSFGNTYICEYCGASNVV